MNRAFKAPTRRGSPLECSDPLGTELDLYCYTGAGGGSPPPPDLNAEYTGELQAKTNAAPEVYGAEAQYDPQYANLNLQDLTNTLLGTPASTNVVPITTNTPGFINSQTGQFSTTDPASAGYAPGSYGATTYGNGPGGGTWVPYTQTGVTDETVNTPATPGYMNLAGQVNTVANQQAQQSQAQQSSGNIQNLNTYGAPGVSALQNLDPQTAALMTSMTNQAQQGIDAGYSLTPAQQRQVTQTVGEGQADRGLGFGPIDQYAAALGVSQYGNQLYQQRQQTAANVAQQRYGMYGAPVTNMITGAPQNYGANSMAQGYGISSNVGPKLFGSDINAQDTFDTAYNGQVSQANAAANNSAATSSALTSGGVSLASSALLALALA